MNRTLYDIVVEPHLHQQIKHDLGKDYAENQINRMTNIELLRTISEALEAAGILGDV